MWIDRDFSPKLRATIAERPVVVVTGARQTGKTSILKHEFSEARYVSLDLPSEAEDAERNGSSFLERHPPPLIVDEVQYAPNLFRFLKIEIDKNRSKNWQFILTGSQKFTLMKGVADSLAGRAVIFELETLSSREIRKSYPESSIEEIILRGGFPELWANKNISMSDFYRSYIASYLERDVRGILEIANLRDFERFLRACALRSGQLLNKADLARDVGISPPTANAWISVLEASNQIRLLEPWFSNKTKSLAKSPKLYLCDTGLLCFLLNISSVSNLASSPHVGQIWETFVFSELRKQQLLDTGGWSVFFFRERHNEIDFLIDRGGNFELIEAKWSEHPSINDIKAYSSFENLVGEERILNATIMSRAKNSYPLGDKIKAISISDLYKPHGG